MQLTIHRGAQQIGGSCIELESATGERLVLDVGRPLDAPRDATGLLPETLDLSRPANVIISHPHMDHWGLLDEVPAAWPVWTGEKSAKLITLTSELFGQVARADLHTWNSRSGPIQISPFKVTPHLTDHSAFDAYMMTIACDGKTVFYTGDFRTHGRKSILVEELLQSSLPPIDVLLMEGTNLRSSKPATTEGDVEQQFVDLAAKTRRHVFVDWSAQNIDRTVSLFRAARRTGRKFVIDLYSADVLDSIAAGTGVPHPSSDGFPELQVVITKRLARMYHRRKRGSFVTKHAEGGRGCGAASLAGSERAIIMCRNSMVEDFASKGLEFTSDDAFVHSSWVGYLDEADPSTAWATAQARGAATSLIHTSGHASADELARVATTLDPKTLVPVHGVKWDDHGLKLPFITRLRDGEAWTVP